MILRSLGAVVAVVATCTAPLPPAAADPVAAVISIEATIGCFGCGTYGPAGNALSGTVLAGTAPFDTGATLTGSYTVNQATGAACVVSGSASGTLTTSNGYTTSFAWTQVPGGATWTIAGSSSGASTFTVVSPTGLPCGAVATVRMLLVVGGETAGTAAKGHVTIHRFPQSAGALAGVRLWAAPVAQDGTPWSCRDIHTGAPVGQGDVLSSPHPGVTCLPPSGFTIGCHRLVGGGYAAEGSGSIALGAACVGLTTGTTMQVPTAFNYAPAVTGNATTPWSCAVHESLPSPQDTDYWVFCQVNT